VPAETREFWIDVGGTFTDCIARRLDGSLDHHKLLSTGIYRGRVQSGSSRDCIIDPARRADPPGFFDGFTLALAAPDAKGANADGVTGVVRSFDADAGRLLLAKPLSAAPWPGTTYELSCGQQAPIVAIRWLTGSRLGDDIGPLDVRLGTTRGTNALLERKGAATAFVTTAGFGDLLIIGDQTRPRLFDLHIRRPAPLYRTVIELDERIDARGNVLRPLDEKSARIEFDRARQIGVVAVAICLLNSHRNPTHERLAEQAARSAGFEHVSVSTRLSPLVGVLARAETALIDAYLSPVMRCYVDELRRAMPQARLRLMTSAGSLVAAEDFVAKDGILSGPAGGVVGVAHVARQAGVGKVIGFDMGGTSTDISRFDGRLERRYEMEVADPRTGGHRRIVAPLLAIETVAAGGGSICAFDGIKPTVGPASAGADPGPACYGRGGPLCVTDANLLLGRIRPEHFPLPLDSAAVESRLHDLCDRIHAATGKRYAPAELAAGYVEIANAHMAAGIRKASIARGFDPREYALVAFGGAGGQHACEVARILGIKRIILPPSAGVLSAYGVGTADVTKFAVRDVGRPLTTPLPADLAEWFTRQEADLRAVLAAEGFGPHDLDPPLCLLDLRYEGQDVVVPTARPRDDDWACAFAALHRLLYGFDLPSRRIEIRAARLEFTGRTCKPRTAERTGDVSESRPAGSVPVFFGNGFLPTPLMNRSDLLVGQSIQGPAILLEPSSTIVLAPYWRATLCPAGALILEDLAGDQNIGFARDAAPAQRAAAHPASEQLAPPQPERPPPRLAVWRRGIRAAHDSPDPLDLELFNNQFADIAEQMGATLQRTAVSTNVKERRDYSCAIYDSKGGLVAHAAHIPVHVGAMGLCVQCLIEDLARDPDSAPIADGEVFVTNDPFRGGSHLPDVTVITPVFDETGGEVIFFVASRAHHAEIGGISPGSMPPQSRSLAEEGVLIRSMRLLTVADSVRQAAPGFRDQALRSVLAAPPHPSRAIDQNIADIQAQMAANHRGATQLRAMVERHGAPRVLSYMGHLQRAAETKMRSALGRVPDGVHEFTDAMDDGSVIAVKVTIRGDEATVDFSGSGDVHSGNLNATPAIVTSAVLYVFRCLIAEDIPMNAGVLTPIRIILPPGLLNPPPHPERVRSPAVAGGNVETSQRIVDVLFGALGVAAAGQGTMNNLAFGNDAFGYYETICGGAGAGPDFAGVSGVHTHMTNTRMTDPEVFEERYPVRLRRFCLRRGSGGAGARRGGDGVIREIEFLQPLDLSLLTQRRKRPPYGLLGGRPGAVGRNLLVRAPQAEGGEPGRQSIESGEELPPICSVQVRPGDALIIETPGGGGFGPANDRT